MPTLIHCPSCERQLRVPDELLGAKVKCPTCQSTFDATSDSAPGIPPSKPVPWPTERVSPEAPHGPEPNQDGAPSRPREDAWRPCPHCGEEIRKEAAHCRFCGEDIHDEDERPWERGDARDTVRRDCEPHRGGMILTLGIISMVLSGTAVLTVVGLPMAIAAWVMGHRDLIKIRDRAMDPQGKGITQAGWICGMVGTALNSLFGLLCVGYALFVGLMISAFSTMPPPAPAPAPLNVPTATRKATPPAPVPAPKDKDARIRP
jgi:predicted Zn finger-like uncharacterized protein